MKSSIWEICWGSTWFWRIYIWRDICRAHEFDRLIRRAIIRRNRSKHNMDMGRILQKTNLSFAFSHKGHTMVEVGLACFLCCIMWIYHKWVIWQNWPLWWQKIIKRHFPLPALISFTYLADLQECSFLTMDIWEKVHVWIL